MAIRLRQVDGTWIALCAVESDPKEGDIYIDDAQHNALATKFADDWGGYGVDERVKTLMNTQKVRDAKEEMDKWQQAADAYRSENPNMVEFGWTEIQPYWERLFGSHEQSLASVIE